MNLLLKSKNSSMIYKCLLLVLKETKLHQMELMLLSLGNQQEVMLPLERVKILEDLEILLPCFLVIKVLFKI